MEYTKEEIEYWLNKIYPIELENLTRKYMKKKIQYNPKNGDRVSFKGMDRNEAYEKALNELAPIKEKYVNMLDNISRSSSKVKWFITKKSKKISLPKPIKPTKTKIKKYDDAPRSPLGYKRKLYIPKRFIRRSGSYWSADFYILSDINDLLKSGKIKDNKIDCTFIWNGHSEYDCEQCKSLNNTKVEFEDLLKRGTMDVVNSLGQVSPLGTWGITHYNCLCSVDLSFIIIGPGGEMFPIKGRVSYEGVEKGLYDIIRKYKEIKIININNNNNNNKNI